MPHVWWTREGLRLHIPTGYAALTGRAIRCGWAVHCPWSLTTWLLLYPAIQPRFPLWAHRFSRSKLYCMPAEELHALLPTGILLLTLLLRGLHAQFVTQLV